jgi:hypothetical protein
MAISVTSVRLYSEYLRFTWVGYQSPARNPKLEDQSQPPPPFPFNEEFYLLRYNAIYSVMSLKLEHFIMTILRTSNSTVHLTFRGSLEVFLQIENEGLKQPALSYS